jgi:hypothetical protein
MQPKDPVAPPEERERPAPARERPLLMIDVDGVISLFGVPSLDASGRRAVEGSLHSIEGTPHFLSATAAAHLLALRPLFEFVWASGWEERADEHLPYLLGLPAGLPFVRFSRRIGSLPTQTNAHWKLESIEAYAQGRPLAWVDDALGPACHAWARERAAPTLLVQTAPALGLTAREAELLAAWARELWAGRLAQPA